MLLSVCGGPAGASTHWTPCGSGPSHGRIVLTVGSSSSCGWAWRAHPDAAARSPSGSRGRPLPPGWGLAVPRGPQDLRRKELKMRERRPDPSLRPSPPICTSPSPPLLLPSPPPSPPLPHLHFPSPSSSPPPVPCSQSPFPPAPLPSPPPSALPLPPAPPPPSPAE